MGDADLSELERRFRASGSPQDEASWLRARVRAGELKPKELELAAYVGYQPAVLASDLEAAPRKPLEAWCRGLSHFGRLVLVRAGLAAIDEVLERRGASPNETILAARTWARCPCPRHQAATPVPEVAGVSPSWLGRLSLLLHFVLDPDRAAGLEDLEAAPLLEDLDVMRLLLVRSPPLEMAVS